MTPLISICIPAYKNAAYLDILLRSVEAQSFRDYEVVVSDDSPDTEVEFLCKRYASKFALQYQKNTIPKGSPANWNAGIKMAKGKWIKIMHDDDWFSSEHSLDIFAKAAQDNPGANFIFSGYTNYENGKIKKTNIPGSFVKRKLEEPLNLIAVNYIGHPSTTLVKNNHTAWYDEHTKWVVDIEFYVRCLQTTSFYMISESLINIGINNEQITKAAFRNSSIEIPENLYLLQKMGVGILKKITVYDHYWRVFRNLGIRSMEELQQYQGENNIPGKLKKMLNMQFKIPLPLLRVGAFSKIFMAISYYRN
ncbi:MAG: glycosyltransferase family 2 protein [Ferruginibacter sp.]